MIRPAWLLLCLPLQAAEVFHYRAEWRLMHAGDVRLQLDSSAANMKLTTTGLAAKLYPLKDDYSVQFRRNACADSILFKMEEGSKRREAKTSFPPIFGKSSYIEMDLVENKVAREASLDVPNCVYDVIAALLKVRKDLPPPGVKLALPISDGRKFAQVEIKSLEREKVKTPTGEFNAVLYEAGLFNGVIYRRKAKMFFWLSDDQRRLPVQVRVQMPFYLGTVTIQLEKEERP